MPRRCDSTTSPRFAIEFTARDHAYRFVCAPGDETTLMHAVRSMADDPTEDLDWFDAALVAYELARRVQRPEITTALKPDTHNPFQSEH